MEPMLCHECKEADPDSCSSTCSADDFPIEKFCDACAASGIDPVSAMSVLVIDRENDSNGRNAIIARIRKFVAANPGRYPFNLAPTTS